MRAGSATPRARTSTRPRAHPFTWQCCSGSPAGARAGNFGSMLFHPRPSRGARPRARPRGRSVAASSVAASTVAASALGLAVGAAAASAPRPAAAQWPRVSGSVDLGAASVAYDDFLRSAVFSLVPAARLETARTTLVARGAYSRFESGSDALQASVAASAISPEVLHVRVEAFGNLATTRYGDSVAATNLYGLGRFHLATPQAGVWAGLGGGFVSQLSLLPNELVQGDLGAWVRHGGVTWTATVTPSRLGQVGYADATLGARWQGGRTELAGSVGGRRKWGELPGVSQWAEVNATYWLAGRLAAVGGVGAFPANVQQGLPGGRYASLAVRLGPRRPLTSDPALRAELTLPYELERLRRRPSGPAGFTVATNPDGTRRLRLQLPPTVRTVELMGDFSDWTPVALVPRGAGLWEYEVFLAPGVHRLNVRLDGGAWVVPPGLTAARDEFGGEVGLLVVQ